MIDGSLVNLSALAETIRSSLDVALLDKNIAPDEPRRVKLQTEADRIALMVEANQELTEETREWLLKLIYKGRPTNTIRVMRGILQEVGKHESV